MPTSIRAVLLVALGLGLAGCGSKCGPTTCSGCCSAEGACQTSSVESCGRGGGACQACAPLESCFQGACLPPGGATGGTAAGSTSAGSSSGSASSSTAAGSTGTSSSTGSTGSTASSSASSSSASSSSTTTTASSSSASTGSSGGSAPPVIQSLGASPMTLHPGDSTVVSAIVTDPQGLSDLAGGTLNDAASSQLYGAFGTPGGQGTFTFTLTWAGLNGIAPTNVPAGGTTRELSATFFDNEGHSTTQTLTLNLVCSPSGDWECSGVCYDLLSDPQHCGACSSVVPSGGSCQNGVPSCPPGQTDCSGFCRELATDLGACGACGLSCYTWADTHGFSAVGLLPSCVQGSCAIRGNAGPGENCADACTAISSALSCQAQFACPLPDGGSSASDYAGCGDYTDPAVTTFCAEFPGQDCLTPAALTTSPCTVDGADAGVGQLDQTYCTCIAP